jgi:putative membrane protein
MMFWPDHDLTGWGWTAMTISMLLFWGLLIAGGVLLVRALTRLSGSADGPGRPSPEQLLAERYARGEIDDEEYRTRLATLMGRDRSSPAP